MKNGDLSNESPKRILVSLDYVALPPDPTMMNRVRRKLGKHLCDRYTVLPATLADLWRISGRYGVHMELVAVGIEARELDAFVDRLDAGQAHPFTHHQAYPTLQDLIATLPYRPEVLGVIDEPQRGLRYGHWYMSTSGL